MDGIVESVPVSQVDTALQLMTFDTSLNTNALELIIAMKCEEKTHVNSHNGKGLFLVRGSKLLTASLNVLTDNPVGFLGHKGCGYEGCAHSYVNSLQEQLHKLSEWVPCFNKAWAHDVRLEDR